MFIILMINTVLVSLLYAESPHTISSYIKAKRILKHIYNTNRKTFYCQCNYLGRSIDPKCDYQAVKNKQRASRLEWEHVVPRKRMGENMTCWNEAICKTRRGQRYKGKRCCSKINPLYQAMEADLYNIVPVIGDLKVYRDEANFAQVNTPTKNNKQCGVKVDTQAHIIEPPDNIKGDIARIYFYMSSTYNIALSAEEIQRFTQWNNLDPVDDKERALAKKKQQKQGNSNPYIR